MHPDKVFGATRVILDALRQQIAEREDVRDAARVIAQWLDETVSWNEAGGAGRAGERAPARAPSSAGVGREGGRTERGRPPADLGLVVLRSRLKGEACRWMIERARLLDAGADRDAEVRPVDTGLLERAREYRGCWLWMFDPYGKTPDATTLERLAGCYDALATAVELVEEMTASGEQDPLTLRDMYYLLAESQSMLWAALREAGVDRDQDQTDAFIWLREKTREQRVYVERHMRREDPADPTKWEDLQQRLDDFTERWREGMGDRGALEALHNRLRYHVERIAGDLVDEKTHDWERLVDAIDELAEAGEDPQSDRVQETLAALPDEIPDMDLSEEAERALNIVESESS